MAYINLDEIMCRPTAAERYEAALEAFGDLRNIVSKKVAAELKEKGLSLPALSRGLQVDIGGLSKRLRANFSLPFDALRILSYYYLDKSCHEVMFGEKHATRLRGETAALARSLSRLPARGRNNVLELAYTIYRKEADIGRISVNPPSSQIIRERIKEIADGKYCAEIEIFGADAPPFLKSCIVKYMADDSAYVGKINSLMFYTLELNTSLDYFISADYTKYTTLSYLDGGAERTVSDVKTAQIIGKYLCLSPEGRARLAAEVICRLAESSGQPEGADTDTFEII